MSDEQLGRLMQQAMKIQQSMATAREELKSRKVDAVVDAGSVKVTANGVQEIVEIVLDPGIIHPANARILQELLVKAVNKALDNSKNLANQEMARITGGLNIPNFPGLF